MAAAKSQEFPSSSSSSSRCEYQVFLSFRGEDTRKNFTDHLYAALVQARIHTFRDDDEIHRGENIESEIQMAIQQSKLSVIVFSKDYASSRWCLDELVMIMEQKRAAGCKVFPVFYHVDPSHVRKQTGSFAAAFVEHEKRFHAEMERVTGWRNALKEVADLAGMVLGERHEAEFVKSIVETISKELNLTKFHVPYFIGRASLMKCINSWLRSGPEGGEIAMLYGFGGVGKTTIAKSIYNQNFYNFESISFVGNIAQKSKESNYLLSLQRQLLCDVLNKNASEIRDVDEGIIKVRDAICCKRILLILDDVDNKDQFNAIIGMRKWLYPGSKIIITTRIKELFAVYEECVKFKVEPLDKKESTELFSLHAFGQAHPVEEFIEHSKSVVHHCNGLPLALRAIGSSLSSSRIKEVWESALQEMEKIPNCKVQKVLKISYDSLDDDYQKDLFLDIACFFIGMDVDYLVQILNGLGVCAKWRVNNLINRCLVEIDKQKRLWMHQLIRDMGREIARQQSPICQRIWHYEEAFNTLKESMDTEMVHGLTLDMHSLLEDNQSKVLHHENPLRSALVHYQPNSLKRRRLSGFFSSEWSRFSNIFSKNQEQQIRHTSLLPPLDATAFRKMKKIKFLQLNYVKFQESFEQFPKSLLWLRWHGFSLRSIPKQFWLEKLVVLDMQSSSLVDVWRGKMPFPKLKILDLSHSHSLLRTPDFSLAPHIERLILEDCIHLVQIHQSIGDLDSLLILNLRDCKSLEELPKEVNNLNSLKELILDGCSSLDVLNIKLEQLQQRWSLHRVGIVDNISYMAAFPLKLFSHFRLSQMTNLRFSASSLPCSLVRLDLSGTLIRCLPESIKDLSTLNALALSNCQMLQTVPELPTSLLSLHLYNCRSLERVARLTTPFINLWHCHLLEIQEWMEQDLIQRFNIGMIMNMWMTITDIMDAIEIPRSFQMLREHGIFSFGLHGYDFSSFFIDEFRFQIQSEHPKFEFKIHPSIQGHKIGELILYARLKIMFPTQAKDSLLVVISNNTKDQRVAYIPESALIKGEAKYPVGTIYETLWTSHWVNGVDDDLQFDYGDEVSVWVRSKDPTIEINMVAVDIINVEEDYNMESDNCVSQKAQIASCIFSYFRCCLRYVTLDKSFYSFKIMES